MATTIERRPARSDGVGGVDPGIPELDFGGGGAGWVELARAHDDIEAHLLGGRLAEAGIETRTLKDRSGPGAWLLGGSDPWAPVAVFVRKVQLEDARLVLAEISWGQPARDRQEQVAAGLAPRHAWGWAIAAIVLGLAFTSIALARTADVLTGCDLPLICADAEGSR